MGVSISNSQIFDVISRLRRNKQLQAVFALLILFFCVFIVFPALMIFRQAFTKAGSPSLEYFFTVLSNKNIFTAFINSLKVSLFSALITTFLAFLLAYAQNFTNMPLKLKKTFRVLAVFPMLIPTITYGFAVIYSFGKNELAGKLFTEGTDIEADVIAINSFYIESTQKANSMYKNLSFKEDCLVPYESYYLPFIGNYGSILINTKVMEEKKLPYPKTIRDLANPVYKDWISVCDLAGSTTAWYMFLPLISDYGEEETKKILHSIYSNAGPHLEMSGSAPLKKVRAGEVALGFGLRHQAVKDKKKGLPVDFIDPAEGSYSMTESIAVIDKGSKTNPLAEEMLKTMIEKGRSDLIKDYPVPIYKGESVASENIVPNGKVFKEALNAELFTKHREISESAK